MGQRLSTLAARVAYRTDYGLCERGEEKGPRMHREDGVGGGEGDNVGERSPRAS